MDAILKFIYAMFLFLFLFVTTRNVEALFECNRDFVCGNDDECVYPYAVQCIHRYCKCLKSRN
ncbi:putative Late nodulin [Medicago truncatula]|uniref:Nodule-specific cysteine-rich peptide 121 n=1 Tax=Medicago truncatula TaxID=3880 RepID=A7KH93_MEDTR|nr:nodule-specific cysteine-rich peptide 121 [Medicago truncatula]RHN74127.1 putative Late nodulin [Medicago truncatula]